MVQNQVIRIILPGLIKKFGQGQKGKEDVNVKSIVEGVLIFATRGVGGRRFLAVVFFNSCP